MTAIVIVSLISTAPLGYALTLGPAIRISTNTYASSSPSVAASGSYVYVAWEDETPVPGSGTTYEVWMRVSSNSGASFGSPIRISTNTGSSIDPAVAALGNYVYVAWSDNTPVAGSGDEYEIWLRVSSNCGATFGAPIRMTTNTGGSSSPSIAAVGNYVYVAWEDTTPVSGSESSAEIWLRVSSNYGASFGSAIRMTTNKGWSAYPSVASVANYVYVVWQDDTPVLGSGSTPEVWLRVSSNYGASFGSPFRISTNTYSSEYPSVAASSSYVYVAWADWTPVSGSDSKPEIWVRVSSNYGASLGSAIRITTNAYFSDYPSVALIGSYAYIAWMDSTPVTGSGDAPEIWMCVSSNNGASFGSAIRLTTNTGWSWYPSVAAVSGHVYVAWHDNTPATGSGGSPEIWLRVGS
jgi:hypothetical protein